MIQKPPWGTFLTEGAPRLLFFIWSGLRDSLGSLLRSPTRTRPTNSLPDCSLLRNGLFEFLIPQPKNKKRRSTRLLLSLFWSGLRDSNSLPSPWQGDALPDELNPQLQNQLYRYLSVLSSPKLIFTDFVLPYNMPAAFGIRGKFAVQPCRQRCFHSSYKSKLYRRLLKIPSSFAHRLTVF